MRAPALLPPALLTCCGWLLAPVSALGPAPSRPAAPTVPGGSAPGARLYCTSGSRAGLGRGAEILQARALEWVAISFYNA